MGAAIFKFIGGIRGAAIILLVVAVGGWLFVQKGKVDDAIEERDEAIRQRDAMVVERDKAIEAARVNSETITRLQQEKDLINQALNAYQLLQNQNRAAAGAREVIIQREAAVPANSAQTAPIIGTIVAEIQADRIRRRGTQGVQQ